ncbi:hypothetical protein GCM10010498_61820 [Streptomyces cavourensis]|nr:hypothetical protein GCM10010498_61820 [Streptomyces cavourensis]
MAQVGEGQGQQAVGRHGLSVECHHAASMSGRPPPRGGAVPYAKGAAALVGPPPLSRTAAYYWMTVIRSVAGGASGDVAEEWAAR